MRQQSTKPIPRPPVPPGPRARAQADAEAASFEQRIYDEERAAIAAREAAAKQPPVRPAPAPANDTKYTVLNAKILVETDHVTQAEHNRIVNWMVSRLKSSTNNINGGYALVVVYDEKMKAILGSDSTGLKVASSETGQIMSDFFRLDDAS